MNVRQALTSGTYSNNERCCMLVFAVKVVIAHVGMTVFVPEVVVEVVVETVV